jgi:hypothetical protein
MTPGTQCYSRYFSRTKIIAMWTPTSANSCCKSRPEALDDHVKAIAKKGGFDLQAAETAEKLSAIIARKTQAKARAKLSWPFGP